MTVPATPRRVGPFFGNGVTTSFPFTFKCFTVDDFTLTVMDASGNATPLVRGTDYTATLNADQNASPGGTITYPLSGAPLPTGFTLAGVGALAYDQTSSFPPGGSYRAITHENAFDRTVEQIQQLAEISERSFTVPVGEVPAVLPPASARANTQWLNDSQGRLFFGAPVSGSAADVLIQLANTADPTKNSALIGYQLDVAGAQPRTVKDRLKGERWIEDLIPVGAVTHQAYFTAAANIGGVWHVGPGPFTFAPTGGCVGTSGFKLFCHGTTITHLSTTTPAFQFNDRSYWGIYGPLRIVGNGIAAGSAVGIQRVGGRSFEVKDVLCENIDGWGFREVNGASMGNPRGDRGNWINCRAVSCTYGREDIASDSTEYNLWLNFTAAGCRIGCITAAGNNRFVSGNIVDNLDGGVWVKGAVGNNHAHGGFVGCNINHNGPNSGGYNIRCTDVENGETFVGCHVYGDNAGTGTIWIERSKGIMFTGGILDATVFCDAPTGFSLISNNFCPDSVNTIGKSGPGGPTDPGVTKIIMSGNFTRAGMWRFNDPAGALFARSARSGNQSIPSATDTTLIWNAESYDTRAAYDNTNGRFTAPWLGNYRITGSVRITAASGIPAGGGVLSLKVNGVAQFFAPLPAQSATQAVANFSFTAGLPAGATAEISATLTGVTAVFDIGQLTIEELT